MELFLFNEAISLLGLNEVTLQGRMFTWANMHPHQFLKNWIGFLVTCNSWAPYPDTTLKALEMTPYHYPHVINIFTCIPNTGEYVMMEELIAYIWDMTLIQVTKVEKIKLMLGSTDRLQVWMASWRLWSEGPHVIVKLEQDLSPMDWRNSDKQVRSRSMNQYGHMMIWSGSYHL